MGSGRRYDPRLPGSSSRGKTLASPPHLVPQLLLQLPVVVVPDQEVQGEVAASVAGRGHGEGGPQILFYTGIFCSNVKASGLMLPI